MMFKRLNDDNSGTIQILVAVCMMVLALMAALVFNTANQTQNKIKMQNAEDASLISGSKWMARGLNIISADNVGMTQTLAMIITLRAMDHTFRFYNTGRLIDVIHNAYLLIPFVGEIIWNVIEVVRQPGDLADAAIGKPTLFYGNDVLASAPGKASSSSTLTDPPDSSGKGILWRVMDAFMYMSEMTYYAAPLLMEFSAYDVATKNGAEAGVLVRGGLGLLPIMPVHAGKFADICKPTKFGSPANTVQTLGYDPLYGYGRGHGPLYRFAPAQAPKIPFWFWAWAGAPWAYDAAVNLNYYLLCAGDKPSPPDPIETPVNPYCKAANNPTVSGLEWERTTWKLEQKYDFNGPEPSPLQVTFDGKNCPQANGANRRSPTYSVEGAQEANNTSIAIQNQVANTIMPTRIDDRRGWTVVSSDRFTTNSNWKPEGVGVQRIADGCNIPGGCDKWQKREVVKPAPVVCSLDSGIRLTADATIDARNPTVVHGSFPGVQPQDCLVTPTQGTPIGIASINGQDLVLNRAITTNNSNGFVHLTIYRKRLLYSETVTQWAFIKGKKKTKVDEDRSLEKADKDKFPYPLLLGSSDAPTNDPTQLVRQTAAELVYLGIAVSPKGLANARILGVGDGPSATPNTLLSGRISANQLRFPNPGVTPQERFFTYAQSRVYNKTSWDTFTQNWHTKLIRANSMTSLFGLPQQRNSITGLMDVFNKH